MSIKIAEQARQRAEAQAQTVVERSRLLAEGVAADAAARAAMLAAQFAYRPGAGAVAVGACYAPGTAIKHFRRDPAGLTEAAIARQAYFKAQRRGFAPGGETDDWLEAERELLAQQGSGDLSRP